MACIILWLSTLGTWWASLPLMQQCLRVGGIAFNTRTVCRMQVLSSTAYHTILISAKVEMIDTSHWRCTTSILLGVYTSQGGENSCWSKNSNRCGPCLNSWMWVGTLALLNAPVEKAIFVIMLISVHRESECLCTGPTVWVILSQPRWRIKRERRPLQQQQLTRALAHWLEVENSGAFGSMAANVLGMAFMPYYNHILQILETDKELRKTAKGE